MNNYEKQKLNEALTGQCIAEILYLSEDTTYFMFKTQRGEIFTFSSEGEIIDEEGDEVYIENYISAVTMNFDELENYVGKRVTSVTFSGANSNEITICFGTDFITVEFGEEYYGYMPIVYSSRMEYDF